MGPEALWRWQHSGGAAQRLSLERADFGDIEGWAEDRHCAALACYLKSVHVAAQPLPIPRSASLPALLAGSSKARSFFEENFAAFRIRAEQGLLTSYFEPVLQGSRTRSSRFSIPVYRRPPDLAQLPQGHPLAEAGLTAARKLQPVMTLIRRGPKSKPGRFRAEASKSSTSPTPSTPSSCTSRVRAASHSRTVRRRGSPSTGRTAIPMRRSRGFSSSGATSSPGMQNLDGMIAWLRAQPDSAATLNENRSYIFFRELEPAGGGPIGSLGAGLSPGRSLAADPLYHAPGMPIWVAAPQLTFEGQPFRRLAIAQDTGSAIRGPQRGDIFAGSGAEAGGVAGRVRHACEFIVLQPR